MYAIRAMTCKELSIDVVLSTANRDGDGLRLTLQSLQKSTYRDIRVLLVNDSPFPLPENLPTGPIKVEIIDLGENVGLTRALKAVEPLLKAPLIARMDCGDTMDPRRFEMQCKYLTGNENCVLVGARSELLVCGADGVYKMGFSPASDNILDLGKFLLWRNPFVHGSIMFKRDEFAAIGGYDVRFPIAQDFNLYMRMRMRGELYILPEVLYTHRFSLSGSNTIKKNKISLASSLRSRIFLSKPTERISPLFLTGVFRDLLLLAMPSKLVLWLRFGRRIERLVHVDD